MAQEVFILAVEAYGENLAEVRQAFADKVAAFVGDTADAAVEMTQNDPVTAVADGCRFRGSRTYTITVGQPDDPDGGGTA